LTPDEPRSEDAALEAARAEARAAAERLAALEGVPNGSSDERAGRSGAPFSQGQEPEPIQGSGRASSSDCESRASSPAVRGSIVAGVAVAVVLGLWRLGTFDHALVDWGLNAKDCARNDFGAVYCGAELLERQGPRTRSAAAATPR
jgi:hypothetical protein